MIEDFKNLPSMNINIFERKIIGLNLQVNAINERTIFFLIYMAKTRTTTEVFVLNL
jgi:hypothetical protein